MQTERVADKKRSVAISSSLSATEVFETPKRPASSDDVALVATGDDDDDGGDAGDYETIAEDVRAFGRRNFGAIASPYLTPYLYNRRFLDQKYGIRGDGGIFMIGDSAVTVDAASDITIKGKTLKGTKGLWELLIREKADENLISTNGLK
jgi:hypothetical protein